MILLTMLKVNLDSYCSVQKYDHYNLQINN